VELIEAVGNAPVGIDTALFIYLIEEHPTYLPIVRPLFAQVDAGERRGITSAITLLEVLVVPLRHGDDALAAAYYEVLTRSRSLEMVPLDHSQLILAARLRAGHGIATADALQLAAALSAGCGAFVTNDRRLPDVDGLRILQLRDFLA